ncbi:c-type cytochrome [Thalassovita taeanensis]|uniref:Cytochrome c n=1 Tax=Thalassovita taeanensis TaxID=657014 RepID=A0A1H9EKI7_9RHOB|nr:c-type cytochrome [Thalassovita taeanensis]SEQ25518.1 Cytochrome c [Thalassovita taeanensis]
MKLTWIAATVAIGVAGCASVGMPEAPEGALLFSENCALCHGVTGKGNGEIAPGLKPAPADLTGLTQRNKGVFPRAHVLSVIDGYTRMESSDQEMPEFGLLLEGETVPVDVGDGQFSPVPRPLAALMFYLESIQE